MIPPSGHEMTRREALCFLGALAVCAIFPKSGFAAREGSEADDRWNALSEEEKVRVLNNYRRWKQMNRDQKEVVMVRYRRWCTMSPEQRGFMHANAARWRQMTPEERDWLAANLHRYREMNQRRQEQLSRLMEGLRRMEMEQRIRTISRLKQWNRLTPLERMEVKQCFEQCGCPVP